MRRHREYFYRNKRTLSIMHSVRTCKMTLIYCGLLGESLFTYSISVANSTDILHRAFIMFSNYPEYVGIILQTTGLILPGNVIARIPTGALRQYLQFRVIPPEDIPGILNETSKESRAVFSELLPR